MTAPAAPLEKAVEEAKATLTFIEENFVCFPPIETGLRGALVSLLAALDADPSRKCECGMPLTKGLCSGHCDNYE